MPRANECIAWLFYLRLPGIQFTEVEFITVTVI